jgi:hypothetical protein
LVDTTAFKTRGRISCRLPDFDDVRSRLPIPVLPQLPGWEQLYWTAWERLWGSFRQNESEDASLVAAYPSPRPDGAIDMATTAFIANLSGYIPGSFCLIESLDNFYANQHADGFICRRLDSLTGADQHETFEPNSTGPNLLPWAEWRHFRLTGDKERIAAVFQPLLAYHRWLRANRTWRSGLYWTTAYAGGLENQPRVIGSRYHHNHWAWIDASAQAGLNCLLLERMATLLDQPDAVVDLVAERETLTRKINDELWNEEQHFYQDIGPNDTFSPVKSIAAYWMLMDPALVPKERLGSFVQHLRDTWSFRVENALPSMSADSEGYNARTGNGWRGAVWPSLTYMVLRGLNAENALLAHKLAYNHVAMVDRVHEQTGSFWRNYAPEEDGPGEPAEIDESGLTPAAVIAMILENVLGLSVDWPLRRVIWRRCLESEQEYGVRNLPLGADGSLDIVAVGDTLRVRTDSPITLSVYEGQDILQTAVPAGAFEISLK